MEYHSRDKVVIRVLNTILFAALIIITLRYSFFNDIKSLINYIDLNYYMAPFKLVYIFHAVTFCAMGVFVLLQIDSSSYGMKKKVIENYNFFIPAAFFCMILQIYFLVSRNFKVSTIFAFLLTGITIVLYLKAQDLKRYMYSDEIKVFVHPFSIFVSWSLILLMITVNIMLTDNVAQGTSAFVLVATLELIIILLVNLAVLYLFKDRIIVSIQLIYLVCLAVNTHFNGYFMPVGYLSFLSVVLIVVFWIRTFKKTRGGK